jgi:hypothetical protein
METGHDAGTVGVALSVRDDFPGPGAPISIVINLGLMFALGLFWALGGFRE